MLRESGIAAATMYTEYVNKYLFVLNYTSSVERLQITAVNYEDVIFFTNTNVQESKKSDAKISKNRLFQN